MASQTRMIRVLTGLATTLALTLVAPSPAYAVTVTLNTSHTSAPPSVLVTFSGTAAGAPTGAPVAIQRRQGSGSWSTVKTGGSVTSSDTYALKIYVAVGKFSYRAKVGSSSYSPARTVTGNYGRNVAVPAAGSPFTFSARLPKPWTRLIRFQFSTNGTTGWATRGQATSNSTGWVGIRTYLTSTSYVRAMAPATSSLPSWVGPRGIVTIGVDPVIQELLNDTNQHRDSHLGLPPLTLHPSLNKVAGNWAYYMATKCVFKHNPNFAAQYPSGWKAGGENIAAGYAYPDVVAAAWIASTDGHHENIDGKKQPGTGGADPNFTHIGIGYYFGGPCSNASGLKKSYVQNFARF